MLSYTTIYVGLRQLPICVYTHMIKKEAQKSKQLNVSR